jgi:CheY-like chemotaxis protein
MKTILVIDDEPLVRSFVVSVLTRENYRVLEAAGAVEARAVSNDFENVDLVITDHTIETTARLSLVEQLRLCRPHLKVLHMSGYSEDYLLSRGTLPIGTPFLPKPFVHAQLVDAVQRLFTAQADRYATVTTDLPPLIH